MKYSVHSATWFFAELRRWTFSLPLRLLSVISVAATVFSIYGIIVSGVKNIDEGLATPETLTELALTMPFAGVLFTSFMGIIIVGNDFDCGFSNRLFMLKRSILTLVVIKCLVAILLGAVIGILTFAAGIVATEWLMSAKQVDFVPQKDTAEMFRGFMVLYLTGSVWGVAIGLLFRNTAIAIGFHFIYQTIVESSVIKSFPDVGKWLPGGAQAAVVQDPSLPERLEVWQAVAVFALWLLAIFLLSIFVAQRYTQSPKGLTKWWAPKPKKTARLSVQPENNALSQDSLKS